MGIALNFQAFSDWWDFTTTHSEGSNFSSELDGNKSECGGSSTTLESAPKVDIDAIPKVKEKIGGFKEGRHIQSSGSCIEGVAEPFMWQLEWKLDELPSSPTKARIPINTSRLDPTAPAFIPGNPIYDAFPVLDQHRQYYPWQQGGAIHVPYPQPVAFNQNDGYVTSFRNKPSTLWTHPKSRFSNYEKRYPNSYGRVSRRRNLSHKKLMDLWASCEQIYAAENQRKDRYYSLESSED